MQTEEQLGSTQIALLRQDFTHMSTDIAEMKSDFKEFRTFFATKEELAYLKSEQQKLYTALENELRAWKKIAVSILTLVLGAIVLQLIHLPK